MTAPPTAPPALVRLPARSTLPRLVRDPLATVESIGREAAGTPVQLNLGLARPYLVTHPDHVHHVIRNLDVYRREGMMWKPMQRLVGNGIGGEGAHWKASRRVLQPLFTMRRVRSMLTTMATAVTDALDRLGERIPAGQPVHAQEQMTKATQHVMIRTFFGGRISLDDSDRLSNAINVAFAALGARTLAPFVPNAVPMPGDRKFRRAIKLADEIIYPLIREARTHPDGAQDLVTHTVQATDKDGEEFDDQRIRDDLVTMFIAGTETTAYTMTWLWLVLQHHPVEAERITDEVNAVVQGQPLQAEHLDGLTYTRRALQETLRLYPTAWMLPRTVATDDELAGVRLKAGDTVVLTPYLTHRLPEFWKDPDEFRPQRFEPGEAADRHRFAYLPFGAGAHSCIGDHFAMAEAQLLTAGMLSRWRPTIMQPASLQPKAAVNLQPKHHPQMLLEPR